MTDAKRISSEQVEREPRYFVAYADDGPVYPSEDESPHRRLYVFDKPKAMLDFIHDVAVETHRVNATVIGYWASGDDNYPLVADWTGDSLEAHDRMRGEMLDCWAPATTLEDSDEF